MKPGLNILRGLVFCLGFVGLLLSIPFSWFIPPASLMVLYFGISLYGTIVLLPKKHFWFLAIAIQGLPIYFGHFVHRAIMDFKPYRIAAWCFAAYVLLWWISVGIASLHYRYYEKAGVDNPEPIG